MYQLAARSPRDESPALAETKAHRPSSRLHPERRCPQYLERRCPHWRLVGGSDRATPVPTVTSVAVKTGTAVLELDDDYELN